jgi:hypothetical protein
MLSDEKKINARKAGGSGDQRIIYGKNKTTNIISSAKHYKLDEIFSCLSNIFKCDVKKQKYYRYNQKYR